LPNLPREDELHRLLERFESQPNGRIFAPLADCYRKLQRLDEAYKVCVDGLVRHPRYSTGFVVLGKIHLDREEFEEARTAFETVLSIDPENLIALRELAEDARRCGDEKRASALREQLSMLDPSGETLGEEHQETDEISKDHESSGSESGEEAPALLAKRLEELKQEEEETEPIVLTAVSKDDAFQNSSQDFDPEGIFTGETIATVTLADVYYQQGFKAKALEMYRAVLERHPRAPGVAEKARAIEEEMSQLSRRFQETGDEPPSEELRQLEAEDEGREARPDDMGAFRSWIEKHERES
jgi:tetratricopeptide (TPR) repeat protein